MKNLNANIRSHKRGPNLGGIMENYTLIVLVALFFGIVGIIAILEHRRRPQN